MGNTQILGMSIAFSATDCHYAFVMRSAPYIFLLVALLAAASLWSTSGFLRKNDQATLLAGAHDWATGQRQPWAHYYQFDKTYVVYAYNAFFLKLNDRLGLHLDPVALANRATAVVFWVALLVFLTRYHSRIDPVILLATLLAPAILLNTQYVNSTTLSSAFLLLALAGLSGKHRDFTFPLCIFLAVGARADIVLLLPLLAWLLLTFPTVGKQGAETFQRWEKSGPFFPIIGKISGRFSNHWKTILPMLAAAVGALLVGRIWAGSAGAHVDWFFNTRMAAGYIVFGFGAATLVYLLIVGDWIRHTVKAPSITDQLWLTGGLLAFLLPLLFFLPQLHAPRYFWRACEAIWLVSIFWQRPQQPTPGWQISATALRWIVVVAAVAPVLVGLQIPDRTTVRFTLAYPTLFPSGDGHYPMGAYAQQLFRYHHAVQVPIDHNQRIWQAVQSAEFELNADGSVPVMFSPMYGYFRLAGSLRHLPMDVRPREQWADQPFYIDSRTLSRRDMKFRSAAADEVLSQPTRVVSPEFSGIAVIRVGDGDREWNQRTRLLTRLFVGNEYRLGDTAERVPAGHTVWFYDRDSFADSEADEDTGWHYSPHNAPGAHKAWSALPTWMSVQTFGE